MLSKHGDVVRNGELGRIRPEGAELQRLKHGIGPFRVCGFAAGVRFRSSKTMPRKCLIINGWN